MKITFLFTGTTEPGWISTGLAQYISRLKHYCDVEVKEIPLPKNAPKMDPVRLKKAEGDLQLAFPAASDKLILLDEKGKSFSSEQFSVWMGKQLSAGHKRMFFLTGGAFGFSEAVYARADASISLSPLTFTHQMARVVLAEQLYRAFTILRNEHYHHK